MNFVIGMPRSGTTFFLKQLNNIPNVCCFGESLFFGRNFIEPNKNGKYTNKQIDTIFQKYLNYNWINKFDSVQQTNYERILKYNFKLLITNSTVGPKEVFLAISDTFKELTKSDIIFEKTPHHIHFYSRIIKYFPEARFILCYRDVFDFIKSNKFQGLQYNKDIRNKFKSNYHPLISSLTYRKYHSSINLISDKNNVIKVNLNDLNHTMVSTTLNFFNIKYSVQDLLKDKVNSSFEKTSDKRNYKLDSSDLFWIFVILGYKKPSYNLYDPFNVFKILYSIIILIPKIISNLYHLKTIKGSNKFYYILEYLRNRNN